MVFLALGFVLPCACRCLALEKQIPVPAGDGAGTGHPLQGFSLLQPHRWWLQRKKHCRFAPGGSGNDTENPDSSGRTLQGLVAGDKAEGLRPGGLGDCPSCACPAAPRGARLSSLQNRVLANIFVHTLPLMKKK